MRFISCLFSILLLATVNSFYVYLGGTGEQCYYRTIFKEERLLIEIQTAMIESYHRVLLRVRAGSQTVVEREVVHRVKITVPRSTNVIKDEGTFNEMEYEVCFSLVVVQEQSNINDRNDNQDERKQSLPQATAPLGYMLHIKLLTNFEHKLQNKKQLTVNSDYKKIGELSAKLRYINGEQVNLHQINERKQQQTQTYLNSLKMKVIIFSTIEMAMIVSFTAAQLHMLSGYLRRMSVV